jgi:glycosyltransferase involved in cell wall biosynthesis
MPPEHRTDIKPLAIGFDAKRALFNKSGLGNYSRNLLNALALNYPANTYILFTPSMKERMILNRDEIYRFVSPGNPILKTLPSLWRSRYITSDIKKEKPDIFHGLSHELPSGIEKTGVKSVVTVHDIIFMRHPHLYKPVDRKIYTAKLVHACRVADAIVAISGQTKKDIVEVLGIDPGKISVIYQGCNPLFRAAKNPEVEESQIRKFRLPEKYLLYVGTVEERKNLLGIIKALHLRKIDLPLVVVGRIVRSYYKKISDYINRNNIGNVIFINGISNTDLPAIYRKAECFIYPSFIEGFGIPLVEALVSGTPVITSEGGCFPEAAGPGSMYVNPHDPDQIGRVVEKVLGDQSLRNEMIRSGLEYSGRFRDEIIAADYMKLYKSL